jgi:hypothetical protein
MKERVPIIEITSRQRLPIETISMGRTERCWRSDLPIEARAGLCCTKIRIEIADLAKKLIEMRRWLAQHGCREQVFHCVRVGSQAVVTVEFDNHGPGLVDHFLQQFGPER